MMIERALAALGSPDTPPKKYAAVLARGITIDGDHHETLSAIAGVMPFFGPAIITAVREMARRGHDVDQLYVEFRDIAGSTTLLLDALWSGSTDLVATLLSVGADPYVHGRTGDGKPSLKPMQMTEKLPASEAAKEKQALMQSWLARRLVGDLLVGRPEATPLTPAP